MPFHQDVSGNLRRLRLVVHSAKGLVSTDATGVSDPYCIVVPVRHDGSEVLAVAVLLCSVIVTSGYVRYFFLVVGIVVTFFFFVILCSFFFFVVLPFYLFILFCQTGTSVGVLRIYLHLLL